MFGTFALSGARPLAVVAVMAVALLAPAASAAVITFDTTATGEPLAASPSFGVFPALREEYAPLGVHFFGPSVDLPFGGVILDQGSNFGVPARSGANFLAFSWEGGSGYRDPETITFDTPATQVSIYAAGGREVGQFLMQAYNASNVLVASDTVSTQGWGELSVASAAGITRVVLTELGPDLAYVYDDLSFTPIPEPIGAGLCLAAVAMVAARRRR